jgi:hypothetical protein
MLASTVDINGISAPRQFGGRWIQVNDTTSITSPLLRESYCLIGQLKVPVFNTTEYGKVLSLRGASCLSLFFLCPPVAVK